MFYTTEEGEWSLSDFIKKHRLPCLAKVKQGFYGDSQHNVLDTGQVLRFHGVYTEHRVNAQVLNDPTCCFGSGAMTVSLPLTCDIPMLLQQTGKLASNSKLLKHLVSKERKLPFDVKLEITRNSICMIRSENERRALTGRVHLRVFEKHFLKFIFGNPVSEDKIYGNIISILVDNCDAKLSLVTGLTNGDRGYYEHILHHMGNAVDAHVKFEDKVGHRDIFVSSIKREQSDNKPIGQKTSQVSQTKPVEIYLKPSPVILDDHVYEEIKEKKRNTTGDPNLQYEEISVLQHQLHVCEPTMQGLDRQLKLTEHPDEAQGSTPINRILSSTAHPGPLHPRPCIKVGKYNAKAFKPLPLTPDEIKKRQSNLIQEDKSLPTRKSLSSSDVNKLTIEELCEYLEVLNLSRHTEKFTAEQVDGCLLQDLDEQLLRDEFGFTRFEAIKLKKFATTGYLPQSSSGDQC